MRIVPNKRMQKTGLSVVEVRDAKQSEDFSDFEAAEETKCFAFSVS